MKFFLCVPFSSRVDEAGKVLPDYRQQIEDLTTFIRECGHECYVALEYANWKLGGESEPEAELKHDFEQIDSSDAVIALLEERVSSGIQLENGYAYAKGKKVYVYQIGKPAWSNRAFAQLAGHSIEIVSDEAQFVEQAKKLIALI